MKSLAKYAMIGAALVASSAFADVVPPPSGNGELTLFVRDVNNGNRVYARGLGISINDVLSQSVTTDGSFSGPVQSFDYSLPASIGADGTLSSFLSGGGSTNYVWTVMAADTQTDESTGTRRFLTTTPTDLNVLSFAIPDNGSIAGLWGNIDGMFSDLNGALPDTDGSSTDVNGQWGQTGQTYSNGGDWFGAGFNNENALGDTARLYIVANSTSESLDLARVYQAVDLRLSLTGLLESVGGTTPPPVPVPAAIWLLGSALVGFAGVARRRASEVAPVAA